MPSFDIASEFDAQEVDNAINNTIKAIQTRFDFRGTNTTVEFNKKDKKIALNTSDSSKMKALQEMLISSFIKRNIDPNFLDFQTLEGTSGGNVKLDANLKEGIDKENAKKIVKLIKDLKLKVQAAIQDDKVRVTGKKIDELQEVIQMLKESSKLSIPLQYTNMK